MTTHTDSGPRAQVLGLMTHEPEPEEMAAMAAGYGCEVDFEATGPLMERHRLSF